MGRQYIIVITAALALAACDAEELPVPLQGATEDTSVDFQTDAANPAGDIVPDVPATPDALQPDSGADTTDVTPPVALELGEACAADEACASGACVAHQGEAVCTQSCDAGCPTGWTCGNDGNCRSLYPTLCQPCTTSAGCQGNPGSPHCVHLEGQGGFCGAGCGGGAPCPDGYVCSSVNAIDGATVTQCVPAEGGCPCSEASIAAGRVAWCPGSGVPGGCAGERLCTAAGLGPCVASEPADEACNGADDDCDGAVDESTCDDGNDCTADLCQGAGGCVHSPQNGGGCGGLCIDGGTCVDGECQGTPALDCDDGNQCTDDGCDPKTGCVHPPASGACDDGSECTINDACVDGSCTGDQGPGCAPGEEVDQACGQCGTRACICTNGCEVGECGECVDEGPCAPGQEDVEEEFCEGCAKRSRTRVCGGDCQWGPWGPWTQCQGNSGGECQPDQQESESEPCGNCGTRTRSRTCTDQCGWSPWSQWSECSGQGECAPAANDTQTDSCGNCGTRSRSRTCSDQCTWGSYGSWSGCSGQGTCSPGAKDTQKTGCGNCGQKSRTRTCNSSCQWGSWGSYGSCGGQGACSPGSKSGSGCDACSERTCNSSCQWSGCSLKGGAQCEWKSGSHYRCCGSNKWQFCLPPSYGCVWSSDCETCPGGCGCN